jgi:hypothetical protein
MLLTKEALETEAFRTPLRSQDVERFALQFRQVAQDLRRQYNNRDQSPPRKRHTKQGTVPGLAPDSAPDSAPDPIPQAKTQDLDEWELQYDRHRLIDQGVLLDSSSDESEMDLAAVPEESKEEKLAAVPRTFRKTSLILGRPGSPLRLTLLFGSERVFSKAGDLISKKRNRLAPGTADTIMCLRYWSGLPEITEEEKKRFEQSRRW